MTHYASEPNKYARGRGAISPAIHWNKISEILNINKIDCVNNVKWQFYLNGSKYSDCMIKQGPFTVDEDKIIIDAVIAWGNKGKLYYSSYL